MFVNNVRHERHVFLCLVIAGAHVRFAFDVVLLGLDILGDGYWGLAASSEVTVCVREGPCKRAWHERQVLRSSPLGVPPKSKVSGRVICCGGRGAISRGSYLESEPGRPPEAL